MVKNGRKVTCKSLFSFFKVCMLSLPMFCSNCEFSCKAWNYMCCFERAALNVLLYLCCFKCKYISYEIDIYDILEEVDRSLI